MSTLETRIAEVLDAHSIGAFSGDSTACQCDRTWRKNAYYRAHVTEALAAALAPVIAEAQAVTYDDCDGRWEAAHKMSHHEPWEYLPETNPYRSNDDHR